MSKQENIEKNIAICFDGYQPLITKDQNGHRSLELKFFLEDEQIPDELLQIYLSAHEDELFFIFSNASSKIDRVDFCKRWDAKIMAFINFGILKGKDKKDIIDKLRYDIVQILLYPEGEKDLNDFLIEKSTSVTRKIILKVNESGDILNKVRLPFWYKDIESTRSNIQLQRQEWETILPCEGSDVEFLFNEKEKIAESEFAKIERWLNEE